VADELRFDLTRLAAAAHMVASQLADLEALAYDAAVTDRPRVSGGEVVDLHVVGDERARTALAGIESKTGPLLEHLDNAIALLHSGTDDPIPRTRRQISKGEHVDALRAQERRRRRGEYTPTRTQAQPKIH
jgi:hypothetical protein